MKSETILVLLFCTSAGLYFAGLVLSDLSAIFNVTKFLLHVRDFALGSLFISSFSILFFKHSRWLKISWGASVGFEIMIFIYFRFVSHIGELPFSSLAAELLGSFLTVIAVFLLRVLRYEKSFV